MAGENQMGLLGSELTPDEQKFIDTGGTSGLPEPTDSPAPPAPPEPGKPPAPASGAPAAPGSATTDDDDDTDDAPAPIDPKTGKAPPRRVPYRKFKALEDSFSSANTELTTTRSQLAELRETVARADERMRIINEALASPTPEQQDQADDDPRPDPREDVFAYMEWQERNNQRLMERLAEQVDGINNRTEEFQTQTTQQSQMTAMENQFRSDAQGYAQTQPKFAEAYVFLMNLRNRQYEALGLDDPGQRNARILNEEREIIANAYNNRKNPAEAVYKLALVSGFNPDAAPATPGNGAAAPGAAPTPPQAPGAPASPAVPGTNAGGAQTPSVAEIIESVRNGQGAAQSLSHGGGTPATALTPEILANMSEEDFGRLMDRLPRSKLRELLPGA